MAPSALPMGVLLGTPGQDRHCLWGYSWARQTLPMGVLLVLLGKRHCPWGYSWSPLGKTDTAHGVLLGKTDTAHGDTPGQERHCPWGYFWARQTLSMGILLGTPGQDRHCPWGTPGQDRHCPWGYSCARQTLGALGYSWARDMSSDTVPDWCFRWARVQEGATGQWAGGDVWLQLHQCWEAAPGPSPEESAWEWAHRSLLRCPERHQGKHCHLHALGRLPVLNCFVVPVKGRGFLCRHRVGKDVAQLVGCWVHCATGTGPRCGKESFSQCQLLVQTLSQCWYSPLSASALMLNIRSIGSHTIIWTHENTALNRSDPWRQNVATQTAGELKIVILCI